jgi:hypothetical protein
VCRPKTPSFRPGIRDRRVCRRFRPRPPSVGERGKEHYAYLARTSPSRSADVPHPSGPREPVLFAGAVLQISHPVYHAPPTRLKFETRLNLVPKSATRQSDSDIHAVRPFGRWNIGVPRVLRRGKNAVLHPQQNEPRDLAVRARDLRLHGQRPLFCNPLGSALGKLDINARESLDPVTTDICEGKLAEKGRLVFYVGCEKKSENPSFVGG